MRGAALDVWGAPSLGQELQRDKAGPAQAPQAQVWQLTGSDR